MALGIHPLYKWFPQRLTTESVRNAQLCWAGHKKYQPHKWVGVLGLYYLQVVCHVSGYMLTRILPPKASCTLSSLSTARLLDALRVRIMDLEENLPREHCPLHRIPPEGAPHSSRCTHKAQSIIGTPLWDCSQHQTDSGMMSMSIGRLVMRNRPNDAQTS